MILSALDEAHVFTVWVLSMLGTVAAIVVVVWLVYGITKSVLVIDTNLDEIVLVGRKILDNTLPLFDLEKTARLGEQMRTTVASIEEDAKAVLQMAAAGPRRR